MDIVKADYNTRGPNNTVRVSGRRFHRPVRQGDVVWTVDADNMKAKGTVVDVDSNTGRVYLEMDWSSEWDQIGRLSPSHGLSTIRVAGVVIERHDTGLDATRARGAQAPMFI